MIKILMTIALFLSLTLYLEAWKGTLWWCHANMNVNISTIVSEANNFISSALLTTCEVKRLCVLSWALSTYIDVVFTASHSNTLQIHTIACQSLLLSLNTTFLMLQNLLIGIQEGESKAGVKQTQSGSKLESSPKQGWDLGPTWLSDHDGGVGSESWVLFF